MSDLTDIMGEFDSKIDSQIEDARGMQDTVNEIEAARIHGPGKKPIAPVSVLKPVPKPPTNAPTPTAPAPEMPVSVPIAAQPGPNLTLLVSPMPKATVLEVLNTKGRTVYRKLIPANRQGIRLTANVPAGHYIVERLLVVSRTAGDIIANGKAQVTL